MKKAKREQMAATRERKKLTADKDNLTAAGKQTQAKIRRLVEERDRLATERDTLVNAHDELTAEHRQLIAERDELATERDLLSDSQQLLKRELDGAIRARSQVEAELTQIDADVAGTLSERQTIRDQLAAEIKRLEDRSAQALGTEEQLRHQLIAAETRATEADEQRWAQESRLHGASNGHAPVSSAATVWVELGVAIRACEEDIGETISERDAGFTGDLPTYLAISRSALQAIMPALALAGIGRPNRILDLPCGYGRVARALRAAWPVADLVVADQSPAAVSFCAEQFAAEGWIVEDYLALDDDIDRLETFDLIWSSSILTVLEPHRVSAAINALTAMLRPGGVLVAAYHGRNSARRFSEDSDADLQAMGRAALDGGVGFRAGAALGFGTASYTPESLIPHITQERKLMVISITERGWGDHLDLVAISHQDVHHGQKSLLG